MRKKINQEIETSLERISRLVKKNGNYFLPILIVCSDTSADILNISFIPDKEEMFRPLFNKIGEIVSRKIMDAHGFILVGEGVEKSSLMITAKAINGDSRIIFFNPKTGERQIDTGWNDRVCDKAFFMEPTIANLEDLWLSYRLSLIKFQKQDG